MGPVDQVKNFMLKNAMTTLQNVLSMDVRRDLHFKMITLVKVNKEWMAGTPMVTTKR